MAKTWILVAHRSGARVFASRGPGAEMEIVHDLAHPEGRLRERDIDADRPAQVISSSAPAPGGGGAQTASYRTAMREQTGVDRKADDWARQLATLLNKGRALNAYERIVLVAPPSMLGKIRRELDKHTEDLVAAEIDKDLPKIDGDGLRRQLEDVILV